MDYAEAWRRQEQIAEQVRAGGEDCLIFVEHPPVLTLGAGFHAENLLLDEHEYAARGIQIVRTDRGGDVTYHGPGQLVVYPIFDLNRHGRDLHKWLRALEETVIKSLATMNLQSERFPPHTGVWIGERKVAAIGIKVRRWVSVHGIAINCCNELEVYRLFVPCGLHGYGVTSLSQELEQRVPPADLKGPLTRAFESVFGISAEQPTAQKH